MSGKRKRSRPDRYSPGVSQTKKKQCVLAFGGDVAALPVDAPRKASPLKKKSKKIKKKNPNMPSLDFLIIKPAKQENSLPTTAESAKLFNKVVESRSNQSGCTIIVEEEVEMTPKINLHPFFSSKKRKPVPRASTFPSCDKKLLYSDYDIHDAISPIHIHQRVPGPREPAANNSRISVSFWPDSVSFPSPPQGDITSLIPLFERLIVHTDQEECKNKIEQKKVLMATQQQLISNSQSLHQYYLLENELEAYFEEKYASRSIPNSLWVDKYKPTSLFEYHTNTDSAQQLLSWLCVWKDSLSKDKKEKSEDESSEDDSHNYPAFLIQSEDPIGKSSLVHAIAKELDIKVLEVNSSDYHSSRLFRSIEEATQSHHLALQGGERTEQFKVLFFDDVDICQRDEGNYYPSLLSLIKRTKQPIILTCSSIPPELMQSPFIFTHRLCRPKASLNYFLLERHLSLLCIAECPSYSSQLEQTRNVLKRLAYFFHYDQRMLLNTLQFWLRVPCDYKLSDIKLMELTTGLQLSPEIVIDKRSFHSLVSLLNFNSLAESTLANHFPLFPFQNESTDETNSKAGQMKKLRQMQHISSAYDSLCDFDIISTPLYERKTLQEDQRSPQRGTYKRRNVTDFRVKEKPELSTESLFSFPQQPYEVLEKIFATGQALTFAHYLPEHVSLASSLTLDIQAFVMAQKKQQNKFKLYAARRRISLRSAMVSISSSLPTTATIQLICRLEKNRKHTENKRRFLHHLSIALSDKASQQYIETTPKWTNKKK